MKKLSLIAVLVILAVSAVGCGQTNQPPADSAGVPEPNIIFNTLVSVTLPEGTSENTEQGVTALMKQYEQLFDAEESGQVSALNKALGKPVLVDLAVIELLNNLKTVAVQTSGSYDPTTGALVGLWLSEGTVAPPSDEEIQSALTMTGYQNIVTDGQSVTMPAGMQLDIDGAAQGFTAEKAVDYLKSYGIAEGRIDIGDSIRTFGTNGGELWQVEISTYVGENKRLVGVAEVADMAIVTTSIYDRYFEHEGKVYHSVIDPSTGYPTDNGMVSVTVFAPNGWYADALSRACLVLGPQRGLELIHAVENVEAVFVMDSGEVVLSDGMGTNVIFSQQQVVG